MDKLLDMDLVNKKKNQHYRYVLKMDIKTSYERVPHFGMILFD